MAENEAEVQEEEVVEEPPSKDQPEDQPPCEEGAPGWVVTFGDMMSLLLTFFILLLSFATMDKIKYKVLSGSIQSAFGVQEVTPTFTRPQARKVIAKEFSMDFNSQNMLDGMKKIEERENVRTPSGRVDIEVFEDYRGIVLSVGESHMFEAGRADLRPAIWPFLDDVLDLAGSEFVVLIVAGSAHAAGQVALHGEVHTHPVWRRQRAIQCPREIHAGILL